MNDAAHPMTPSVDRTWLDEAKNDIGPWAQSMPTDADGHAIDWDWVRSLELAYGIGCARAADLDADGSQAGPRGGVHELLRQDYAIRDRLEAIIAQCSTTFMGDFDRLIGSYRLPRALAYANRRLNDEIALLIDRGVAEHRWTVSHERRRQATVPVLHAIDGNDRDLADIQDRTAQILEARAAARKSRRRQEHAGRNDMARANLSGVTSPGGAATLFDGPHDGRRTAGARTDGGAGASSAVSRPDWRDAYLPGRDVDTVMGIDIETTGIDPARVYIIDVGFEYMDMASSKPSGGNGTVRYRYEQGDYEAGDAYGQSRLSFGVPDGNARLGNPVIARLTGIDVHDRAASAGYRLFDEWPAAQRGLLIRLERQPYVAHNATFEHGFFMLNVEGYAERYRDGGITIIDTLPMSRRWDPGSMPDETHPYGDNTLESYARRQGALKADQNERHLGLEDAHIMLVAMKRHLDALRAEGRGPWGADGRSGTGGKRCGSRNRG